MKKIYINPNMKVVVLHVTNTLLAGSGVANGSTLGNSYNSNDVSYGHDFDFDDEE